MTIYEFFNSALLQWFRLHGRKNLPWQCPNDPYKTWLSEIMLQQTQVQTVIGYFNRFIQRFPTVIALAKASEDEVLSLWSGLGYYARARNLLQTAKVISQDYQGQFPSTQEALVRLPGIGQTTAAAILSLAFNQATAILDGNVKRVLARFFMIDGELSKSAVHKKLWALADLCMPKTACREYTQAIMDLGALCCTLKNPNCLNCPLSERCLALKHQEQDNYPNKRLKKAKPIQHQQFLVLINQEGLIHLERRPAKGIWGGLWCLPSLDIQDCPLKFVKRCYGLEGVSAQPLVELSHHFTHFHLKINALLINVGAKALSGRWFLKKELSSIGLAKPTSLILSYIPQWL